MNDKTMPWTIKELNPHSSLRINTGHKYRWGCDVHGCGQSGTAPTYGGAESTAAAHSAEHTRE